MLHLPSNALPIANMTTEKFREEFRADVDLEDGVWGFGIIFLFLPSLLLYCTATGPKYNLEGVTFLFRRSSCKYYLSR